MNEAGLDSRSELAVQHALAAEWDKALALNLELIKDYPDDLDTLNRLGRAYTEVGNISKAKSSYQKVLKLDPYNGIAANNLKKLSNMKAADVRKSSAAVNPDIFIEETGKTKVIDLVDLAMGSLLATLRTGDPVKLTATKQEVTIISSENKRIGKLPEDWGQVLAHALSLGSEFSAVIKAVSIDKNPSVSIFVRELKRSSKIVEPTFPTENNNFTPYIREEALGLVANQEPVQTEGDETVEELEIKDIPNEPEGGNFERLDSKSLGPEPAFEEEE